MMDIRYLYKEYTYKYHDYYSEYVPLPLTELQIITTTLLLHYNVVEHAWAQKLHVYTNLKYEVVVPMTQILHGWMDGWYRDGWYRYPQYPYPFG